MPSESRIAAPRPYTQFDPIVPVIRVTDGTKPTIHRFFDTSPISPSGRYIALTEFPFEDRVPQAGDAASVIVLDLEEGREVYRTSTIAWETQLGAQVQWGASDQALYFNRMEPGTWEPYGVEVDVLTGAERKLEGTVYMVSADGRFAVSPCLRRIRHIQPGYGVLVPDSHLPKNSGFADDDGVYITSTETGRRSLLLSLKEIRNTLPELFSRFSEGEGALYTFHVKWNPQGTRIMVVLRWIPSGGVRGLPESCLITADADGKNIRLAIDFKTWKGGHHPNWCPDGDFIVMNLVRRHKGVKFAKVKRLLQKITKRKVFARLGLRYYSDESSLRFARFRFDGAELEVLAPSHLGSGHPTIHVDGVHLLSDAYPREKVAYSDGTVPLRWIHLPTDSEQTVVRIKSVPKFVGQRDALRVDLHPAWDGSCKKVVFNACPDGVRQVYVADFEKLVNTPRLHAEGR